MNLLRVLVLFFLFSCEDNFQEIQNINNPSTWSYSKLKTYIY